MDGVALYVRPLQAHKLTGAQACEHLEAIGVYVVVGHGLIFVQCGVHIEQGQQVGRLQNLFAFEPGTGRHARPSGLNVVSLAARQNLHRARRSEHRQDSVFLDSPAA